MPVPDPLPNPAVPQAAHAPAAAPPATPLTAAPVSLEAARYALLHRLAPSLRHEAVAHLQPLAMVGSILDRRLRAPEPALESIRDDAARLAELTRAALHACLDLVGWLAPEAGRQLPLHEAVAETVTLLRGSLGFRGFNLRNEVVDQAEPIDRERLRHLLPACVLWLSDQAGPPAEITLSTEAGAGGLQLRLGLEPCEGAAAEEPVSSARPLRLAEVQALAEHAGMALAQEGDALVLGLAAPA